MTGIGGNRGQRAEMNRADEDNQQIQLPETQALSRNCPGRCGNSQNDQLRRSGRVPLRLQRITKQQHEDWRFGRIPYLERVCAGNLSTLNVILRILDQHARAIGLKPSQTVYHKWGRGGKHIVLRFSKTGSPALEAAYSRHYVATRRPAGAHDSDPTGTEKDPDGGNQSEVQPTFEAPSPNAETATGRYSPTCDPAV